MIGTAVSWKWIYLKDKFTDEKSARKFLQEKTKNLLKFDLYHQTDEDE